MGLIGDPLGHLVGGGGVLKVHQEGLGLEGVGNGLGVAIQEGEVLLHPDGVGGLDDSGLAFPHVGGNQQGKLVQNGGRIVVGKVESGGKTVESRTLRPGREHT